MLELKKIKPGFETFLVMMGACDGTLRNDAAIRALFVEALRIDADLVRNVLEMRDRLNAALAEASSGANDASATTH